MESRKLKIAVLTGAGVSAESGLSTFRGNNGLWGEYDPREVASIEGWRRDPALVLSFYNGLRKQLARAEPDAAHLAIAEMEKDFSVTVITQNCIFTGKPRKSARRMAYMTGTSRRLR